MKAFISYSHKDEWALEKLHGHLAPLRREGKIDEWFDRKILAGENIDSQISRGLETSELFLPLISPDFIASAYCWEREMKYALDKHAGGTVRIAPIIVEPCDWKQTPLGKLKALPCDGMAIAEWPNRNSAFLNVVTELRRILIDYETNTENNAKNITRHHLTSRNKIKIKRDFDKIDIDEYRDKAFEKFQEYMRHSIDEINMNESIRTRFKILDDSKFSCTVINKLKKNSIGYLTVTKRNNSIGFGDITYSYSEDSSSTSANGAYSIGTDDYEIFLKGIFGASSDIRITVEEGAQELWKQLLERAGISDV